MAFQSNVHLFLETDFQLLMHQRSLLVNCSCQIHFYPIFQRSVLFGIADKHPKEFSFAHKPVRRYLFLKYPSEYLDQYKSQDEIYKERKPQKLFGIQSDIQEEEGTFLREQEIRSANKEVADDFYPEKRHDGNARVQKGITNAY